MKILLVSGFLGSGKTSFILKLAHYMSEEMSIPNIVIIENEIGELSIDDKVLRGYGYEVRGLFSGCVCCTLAGELPVAINKIESELNPDWVIMEATGLAFPGSIRATLENQLDMHCKICTLADAKRWKRINTAMPQLVEGQIESADVVLVNKVDLVDEETVNAVIDDVRKINSSAAVSAMNASGEIPTGIFEEVLGKE